MSDKPFMDQCIELQKRIDTLQTALDWVVGLVGKKTWQDEEMPAEIADVIEESQKRANGA